MKYCVVPFLFFFCCDAKKEKKPNRKKRKKHANKLPKRQGAALKPVFYHKPVFEN